MASIVRSLPLVDTAALLKRLLALLTLVVLVVVIAWYALTPVSVTEGAGPLTAKWAEVSGAGQSTQYWVDVAGDRQARRCAIAAYQTHLVEEWQALQPGDRVTITCYGQSVVGLTRLP